LIGRALAVWPYQEVGFLTSIGKCCAVLVDIP
jgi:hypothetical protein